MNFLIVPQWPLLLVGTLSGFVGSLLDSIFGEILQYSGISGSKKKIIYKI